MVTYPEWVKATHEAYKANGGTYSEGTAAEIVEAAAAFWERNKEELKQIAYREAVRIARRALDP
jgi:hypothetical protein